MWKHSERKSRASLQGHANALRGSYRHKAREIEKEKVRGRERKRESYTSVNSSVMLKVRFRSL